MKKINLKISFIILAYGVFFNNPLVIENTKEATLGIFFYSIPLIFNLIKRVNEFVKIYSIWFGVFMVLQSLVLFSILKPDYITLLPNMNQKVNVKEGVLSNIKGVQNIRTDKKGFRVTKKINYENKANGQYRIFAIGGSTTEQSNLDQKKTWTHLLQEKLNNEYQSFDFEVINTGVSGLRAKHHILTLQEIIKYQPNMVLLLIGINDWNHDIKKHYKSNYKNFIDQLPDFISGLSFDKTLRKFIGNLRINKNLNKELNEVYFPRGSLKKEDKRSYQPKDVLTGYKAALKEISLICQKNEISCVFLTQPSGYKENASSEHKDLFWMTPPEEDYTIHFEDMIYISDLYNKYLIQWANKTNDKICDLDSKIPASLDYMYDDCHFNTTGAKKVSEVLFNCIEEIELKPLNKKI